MIRTASEADLDAQWRDRVRAALVLATWADTLAGMPDPTPALPDDTRRPLPAAPVRPGRRTAAMWVLAEHLARHGGRVVQAEFGRALLGHSRSRAAGLSTPGPAPVPAARAWSGTSLTGRGLLARSSVPHTAPLGLVPGIDLATVARRARRAAALTHPHPQALDLATVQAVAVAAVVRAAVGPVDADAVTDQISGQVHTPGLRMALRRVPSLVRQSANPHRVAGQLHGYPGAAGTVPVALTAFLLHPDDPVAALRFAGRAGGGDARSTMVTTGALSGACLGERALPQPIEIPARLTRIADALARLRAAGRAAQAADRSGVAAPEPATGAGNGRP